jgi:hypothetical protein
METDSRYSLSEMSGPHKTQPSSASMSELRGSVPDQLPWFLYRLCDESPLAGVVGGPTIFSFSESKLNQQSPKK